MLNNPRPHAHTPLQPSPVTVRLLFPTAADSPLTGGIVPLVVEVREPLSERRVFWTERLLIGIEGTVLLDTRQLGQGEYDPAAQEMVYRVLTPLWTLGMPATDTFVWAQAQWVGVPLSERNAPAYYTGAANDSVDITVDSSGSLIVSRVGNGRHAAPSASRTNARVGASERGRTGWQRVERGRRRSVNALRKEAQRRLAKARRTDKTRGASKTRRGGKTTTSSKRPPHTVVKRSHTPDPVITVFPGYFPYPEALPHFVMCARGALLLIAEVNDPAQGIPPEEVEVRFTTTKGTLESDSEWTDGSGVASTLLYGDGTPGSAAVTATVTLGGEPHSDSVTIDMVEVTSVVWQDIDSPTDANPNAGGGLRIFPDKISPTDTTPRNTIRVRATITPQRKGVAVYLKAIDVDDPSSNQALPDGWDDELVATDNRDRASVGSPVKTDANGVAKSVFTVSMQPGDNFKVVASCSDDYIAQVDNVDSNGDGLNAYEYRGIGRTLADRVGLVPAGQVTPEMLTVWRRLHVEVDSMGTVSGNKVTGQIVRVDNNGDGTSTCTLNVQNFSDSRDRFVPGTLKDSNNAIFNVKASEPNLSTVTVQGLPDTGNFELKDDDQLQDGEDVPMPDISRLVSNMSVAYITVLSDGGGNPSNNNDNVTFVQNIAESTLLGQFWESRINNRNDFWVAYVLGSFQGPQSVDFDPGSPDNLFAENPLLGATAGPNDPTGLPGGSFIFDEVIRDALPRVQLTVPQVTYAELRQITVAHEVGHAVAGVADEPVVQEDNSGPAGFGDYVPFYIDMIRACQKPLS